VTTPLYFAGNVRSHVPADMETVETLPAAGVVIDPGDTFFVRLRYTYTGQYPSVNVNFPDPGGASYATSDECDATGDMSAGAIPAGQAYTWNASAVFGTPTDTPTKTIAVIGDSMAFGYTVEPGLGFIRRALNNTHAALLLGYSSDLAHYFVASHTARLPLMLLCDSILIQDGVNDLSSGPGTAAALKADVLAIAALKSTSQRVFVCTVVPQTTSTDSWATTANQTVMAWESERVAYNQWLRDGAPVNTSTGNAAAVGASGGTIARVATYGTTGSAVNAASGPAHPFDGGSGGGIFNSGGAVESATDSGKWKAPGYSFDGIHYTSPAGSTLMAAAIPVTALA
jgi:hypothetical protein